MTGDKSFSDVQKELLISIESKVAELEERMNYKAKPLNEEQQELLDAKIFNAIRMRKWVD
jgi:predicted CopG family antitoxin